MTTQEAAKRYEEEFMAQYCTGKKPAIFNPNNRPFKELPIIYGFNNGGGNTFLSGQLMAEDGTSLGSHMCSSEGYMLNDLGILEGARPDRHEEFKTHYPDGYRMEFVSRDDVPSHSKLQKAYDLNQEQAKKNKNDNSTINS